MALARDEIMRARLWDNRGRWLNLMVATCFLVFVLGLWWAGRSKAGVSMGTRAGREKPTITQTVTLASTATVTATATMSKTPCPPVGVASATLRPTRIFWMPTLAQPGGVAYPAPVATATAASPPTATPASTEPASTEVPTPTEIFDMGLPPVPQTEEGGGP